ncbi:MAG: tRNA glutamyl-Q(34) synthetase GluQRS [Oscillibacter sp.]|nr:tRNA glutamyl-Q(34) synthetase GluQRS [Oscillibacter sp.]
MTGRFAPTPSGDVHLGNAFCYLLAWLSARRQGGQVVLRMEDADQPRTVPGSIGQTLEDLRWLGLDWDQGPEDGVPVPAWFQSARTAVYDRCLEELKKRKLAYPCYCSRADLKLASAPHAGDGHAIYPGICRNLTEAERAQKNRAPAWRLEALDTEIAFADGLQGPVRLNLAWEWGDFPIRRADGVYCYQFIAALDDALMGVTEVVRSRDLLLSTPPQLYVQRLFGLPEPRYVHIPMLLDSKGARLAKRRGGLSLVQLRQRKSPEEVVGALAYLAGLQPRPEPRTAASLTADFSWDRVPREDVLLPEGLL